MAEQSEDATLTPVANGDEWKPGALVRVNAERVEAFSPEAKAAFTEASSKGAAAAPAPSERFFMDHGVWHDRETGRHLYTDDQHNAALNEVKDEAWAALEAAGIPRDGWRTLGESIAKLAARSTPSEVAKEAEAPTDELPVAYLHSISHPDWLEVCDRDAPGAFPVFARPAPSAVAPAAAPIPSDAFAVNFARLAGLDKHKARECETIVRQVLAARSSTPSLSVVWGEPSESTESPNSGRASTPATTPFLVSRHITDEESLEAYVQERMRLEGTARASTPAAPEPPPECQTEAEKTAFAFGWFKALESKRSQEGGDSEQRDAARYRWLRDVAATCPDEKAPWPVTGSGWNNTMPCFGAELDAAIDAAMAKEGKPEGAAR